MNITRIAQAGIATIALATPLALGGAALADQPPVYVGGAVTVQPGEPAYSGGYMTNVGSALAAHHWHHVVYMNRLACGIDRA